MKQAKGNIIKMKDGLDRIFTVNSAAELSFIVHEPSGIMECTSEISLFSKCFI